MPDIPTNLSKLPPSLLNNIAAGRPPPGMKSNLINPISRGAESKIVIYVTLPLMMIFLILRLYVHARVQKSVGGDDWLAVVSALCVGGYCGICLYLVDGPGGEHIWDVAVSRITAGIMKANLSAQCLYALSSIFIKSTLLVLYLRLFHPSQRAVASIWAGIAFIVVSHLAMAIAQIKILVPAPGKSWFNTTGSNVANMATIIVAAQGVISVVTDVYCLCIPMGLVTGLHLPTNRKVGVCAIFMTGLIACVCSLVGTVYRFRLRHTTDMFWDAVPVYTLTVIELNAGIICSCMPLLPVLLKRVGRSESYRKSVSVLRYRFKRSSAATSSNSDEEKKLGTQDSDESYKYKIKLAFPKATMTGLGTFIRGGGRSKFEPSVRNESFAPLESWNDVDDYHEQLKAGRK